MSRQPPPPSLTVAATTFFLLNGGDFVINSIFSSSCSYLLPDPDGPTAAYANGAPFQRYEHQLQRVAFPPRIHLEMVRVQCLIKTCVTPALREEQPLMLIEWSCRLALDRRRKQTRRFESLLLRHELVDVLLAGSSICSQWKWVMKALLEACNTKVCFFSFFCIAI